MKYYDNPVNDWWYKLPLQENERLNQKYGKSCPSDGDICIMYYLERDEYIEEKAKIAFPDAPNMTIVNEQRKGYVYGFKDSDDMLSPELDKLQKEVEKSQKHIDYAEKVGYKASCDNAKLIGKNTILLEALRNIEQQCGNAGLKLVDTENRLQMAIYSSLHFAKEALKSVNSI